MKPEKVGSGLDTTPSQCKHKSATMQSASRWFLEKGWVSQNGGEK